MQNVNHICLSNSLHITNIPIDAKCLTLLSLNYIPVLWSEQSSAALKYAYPPDKGLAKNHKSHKLVNYRQGGQNCPNITISPQLYRYIPPSNGPSQHLYPRQISI